MNYRISRHAESMKPSAGGQIVHESLVDQIPSGLSFQERSMSAVIGSSRDCMRLVKSSEDLTDEDQTLRTPKLDARTCWSAGLFLLRSETCSASFSDVSDVSAETRRNKNRPK